MTSWSAHLVVLLIAIAVTLAYANSLAGGFLLDSRALVLLNPAVQSASWANASALLTHDYWHPLSAGGLYRPATTLSYMLNYAVLGNGDRPFGYHLTNLLLHLGCVALVHALVLRVTRRQWTAIAAAALFGLHPITTEAVTYIAGRADLLTALGTLAALVIHAGVRSGAARVAAFALATALALFAKEGGLVLPVLLLAHDALLGARPGSRARYATVAVLLLVYGLARVYAAQNSLPVEPFPPIDNPLVEADPFTARLTALTVGARELGLLLWPVWLSADYSCCEIPLIGWPPSGRDLLRLGISAVIVAMLAWWTLRQRRSNPGRCFFAVLAVVTWLPASNLVITIGTIMAERTLYLPLAGAAAVVASLLDQLRSRTTALGARAVTAALVVLLGAGALRIWVRNEDWRDDRRLWASAVRAVPGSAKAHAGLAAALFVGQGSGTDIEAIIALGERAIAIRPDYQGALVALGGHYTTKGDRVAAGPQSAEAQTSYARAIAVLERARSLDEAAMERFRQRLSARGTPAGEIPDRADPNLYNNLSLANLRAGRVEEALVAYERSRDLDPLKARRHADVAVVLVQLERWEEAAVELFAAVTLAPDDAELRTWLAELYRRMPDGGGAVAVSAPDQARINLDDPAVRRHRCRALALVAQYYSAAGRADSAASVQAQWSASCQP